MMLSQSALVESAKVVKFARFAVAEFFVSAAGFDFCCSRDVSSVMA